jgi:hypothetical protein
MRLRAHGDTGVYYATRPSARIDRFIETGQAICSRHGEHTDWTLRLNKKHPKGAYRTLRCKPCEREAAREWNKRNPQHLKPYYRSVAGKASGLVGSARARAKKSGMECTITREWIIEQHGRQDGRCAYTGWELRNGVTGRGYARNFYGMSLDRLDSTGGYTPENTRLVCWGVNRAKGDLPMQLLVDMCRAVADTDAG